MSRVPFSFNCNLITSVHEHSLGSPYLSAFIDRDGRVAVWDAACSKLSATFEVSPSSVNQSMLLHCQAWNSLSSLSNP